MFVLTASSERGRAGCLVGFATQCSMHPPRWYVGISNLNRTFEVAATDRLVVVHALGAGDNVAVWPRLLRREQTGDGDVDEVFPLQVAHRA